MLDKEKVFINGMYYKLCSCKSPMLNYFVWVLVVMQTIPRSTKFGSIKLKMIKIIDFWESYIIPWNNIWFLQPANKMGKRKSRQMLLVITNTKNTIWSAEKNTRLASLYSSIWMLHSKAKRVRLNYINCRFLQPKLLQLFKQF